MLQEGRFERVGDNKPIEMDVRIISATNHDLREELRQKTFRIELFYRLNVVPIHIPPLRERTEDLPLLVKHFIGKFNKRFARNICQIAPRAMRELMAYDWPGNVRELENVLERAFVITDGETIERIIFSPGVRKVILDQPFDSVDTDIPFAVAKSAVVRRFEKAYIYEALKQNAGNVSAAAKKTKINPRTLWRKIKEYGLRVDEEWGAAKRLYGDVTM